MQGSVSERSWRGVSVRERERGLRLQSFVDRSRRRSNGAASYRYDFPSLYRLAEGTFSSAYGNKALRGNGLADPATFVTRMKDYD